MATIKRAAKKAVPKVVEEPKQIVLTQDQYDELVGYYELLIDYYALLNLVQTQESIFRGLSTSEGLG